MNRAKEALGYAQEQNWRVFPLKGKKPLTPRGFKNATTDRQVIERWWSTDHPGANIGVRTGSGLLVLDVDDRRGGHDTLHDLGLKLPDTPSSLTGGGGAHYYLTTDRYIRSRTDVWPGVDVKAVGGYVVAPSSTHPSGRPYEWEYSPEEMPRAQAPAWILDKACEHKRAKRLPERIAMGERNETLTSLAGSLRRKGLTEDEIFIALGAVAKRCEGSFPGKEVAKIAKSVARYDAPPWTMNPRGYASRVMDRYGLKGTSTWLVLSELYSLADSRGRVSAGSRYLGERVHLDRATVSRAIELLHAHGLVRKQTVAKGHRAVLALSPDPLPTKGGIRGA